MGQFSWLYANNGNDVHYAMLDNVRADSYLLVPPPFQAKYGKYILEKEYDGYGNMGGYDIYDLIVEWNKDFIPMIIKQRNGKLADGKEMYINDLMNYYEGKEISVPLRYLGIDIACYDEDNESLPFPIKITDAPYEYDSVGASKGDPNQGWGCDDDEDDDDDDWDEEDEVAEDED